MKENQHNMLQGSPQSNGSNLIDEIREIIEKGRKEAYSAANQAVIVSACSPISSMKSEA